MINEIMPGVIDRGTYVELSDGSQVSIEAVAGRPGWWDVTSSVTGKTMRRRFKDYRTAAEVVSREIIEAKETMGIEQYRLFMGLSLEEMGAIVGVSDSAIVIWGKRGLISRNNRNKLLVAFGTDFGLQTSDKRDLTPDKMKLIMFVKSRKMTEQELADKLGVTKQAVSLWKKGKAIPRSPAVKKFMEAGLE